MLTISSTVKPFRGHCAIIQGDGVESLFRLTPKPEIILFGDDDGTAEICAELGLRHEAKTPRCWTGVPYVSSLFEHAKEIAANDVNHLWLPMLKPPVRFAVGSGSTE
jgi:hypothetical protein